MSVENLKNRRQDKIFNRVVSSSKGLRTNHCDSRFGKCKNLLNSRMSQKGQKYFLPNSAGCMYRYR